MYSRRAEAHKTKTIEYVSSNISTSWVRGDGKSGGETLVNGALQGRKQFDVKGASRVCRRRGWKLGLEVLGAITARQIGGKEVVRRICRGLEVDVLCNGGRGERACGMPTRDTEQRKEERVR